MTEDIGILNCSFKNKKRHYGTVEKPFLKSLSNYIIHKLKDEDTIQSLAIQYDTSTEDIKRINNLWNNDELVLRSQIKIPQTYEQTKHKERKEPDINNSQLSRDNSNDSISSEHKSSSPLSIKPFDFLKKYDSQLNNVKETLQKWNQNGNNDSW